MSLSIRKKNGEIIELEDGQTLDASDLLELIGEAPAHPLLAPMAALSSALSTQKPTLPKDWRRADVNITKWDSRGRIETMSIEKIY